MAGIAQPRPQPGVRRRCWPGLPGGFPRGHHRRRQGRLQRLPADRRYYRARGTGDNDLLRLQAFVLRDWVQHICAPSWRALTRIPINVWSS